MPANQKAQPNVAREAGQTVKAWKHKQKANIASLVVLARKEWRMACKYNRACSVKYSETKAIGALTHEAAAQAYIRAARIVKTGDFYAKVKLHGR